MNGAPFLVGGEWRQSKETKPVTNPYSGEIIGHVDQASSADIEDAIAAAGDGFGSTKRLPAFTRADILLPIASQIDAKREEFAQLITSDTGKPIAISRTEVERSIFTFTIAAEEAKRIGGEYIPMDLAPSAAGRFGISRRFPLGPVSAITPFNFPLNLVAHKVAPAIASGNSIILKPASSASRVSLLLGRCICETAFPEQAISIVTCGGDRARQLITDERLRLVSFTGSSTVGWGIKRDAGRKKVVLELGGNAGVIVDRGVPIKDVVPRIAIGAFGNAGQSCIAVQRLFVHNTIIDTFMDEIVSIAESLKTGDPVSDETVVGPMINQEAAVTAETWVKEAVGTGARILTGGGREGSVLQPTVLVDVSPGMKVCSNEVFAPVVTISPFDSFESAVQMINDSRYGLQAGIFTNDLRNALLGYNRLEVGGVVLNDFPTFRIDHMPYGGVKESGFGREGIRYSIEAMTEPKLLVANMSAAVS